MEGKRMSQAKDELMSLAQIDMQKEIYEGRENTRRDERARLYRMLELGIQQDRAEDALMGQIEFLQAFLGHEATLDPSWRRWALRRVLVIDETSDKKGGNWTAHGTRKYSGSLGKLDNGIVAVSSPWADERVDYPLHVEPYTPAKCQVKGADNLPFRTSPQIAVQLIDRALDSGMSSRAVVADCLYGSNDAFQAPLLRAGLPVAVKPKRRYLAPVDESLTVEDVLRGPGWWPAEQPGDWTPMARRFQDATNSVGLWTLISADYLLLLLNRGLRVCYCMPWLAGDWLAVFRMAWGVQGEGQNTSTMAKTSRRP
jgi:hypothetical protein